MSYRRGFPSRGFPARGFPAGWSQGTAIAGAWNPVAPDAYMRVWYDPNDGTGPTEIDLESLGFSLAKLNIGYGQPSRLDFELSASQHTKPIPSRAKIWLVDETYGYFPANPVFEGWTESPQPVSSLRVRYTAYDATRRAAHEVFVRSLPDGVEGDGVTPVEAVGSVPHIVFNVKVDQDEEAAWQREEDASLSTIIQTLLDDAAPRLRNLMACRVGHTPYDSNDLTDLDFIPQDKVVFANQTVPAAVHQVLTFDPRYRTHLVPGVNDRVLRVYDVLDAPATTLTLNETDEAEKIVESLTLNRTLDRRYTACKIYGPRKIVLAQIKVSEADLTELWNGTEESAFNLAGPDGTGVGDVGKKWQIADSTRRNMASRLPSDGLVPLVGGGVAFARTRLPTLCVSYDSGTNWETIKDATFDRLNGIITAPNRAFRYESGGSPAYLVPSEAMLIYAYFDEPLSVRYPTTEGEFDGTAYDVDGMAVVEELYDPGLAVGWENGVPVEEATRTAQYQDLVERRHRGQCDVAYAGGFTLGTIDYDFLRLNARIHIAGLDGDGVTPIVTGWEAIGAIVTDVEYDFAEQTTTATLNGDMLEWMKIDPEALKEQLKIDAEQWRRDTGPVVTVNTIVGGKIVSSSSGPVGGGGGSGSESPYYRDDSNSARYGVGGNGRPNGGGLA